MEPVESDIAVYSASDALASQSASANMRTPEVSGRRGLGDSQVTSGQVLAVPRSLRSEGSRLLGQAHEVMATRAPREASLVVACVEQVTSGASASLDWVQSLTVRGASVDGSSKRPIVISVASAAAVVAAAPGVVTLFLTMREAQAGLWGAQRAVRSASWATHWHLLERLAGLARSAALASSVLMVVVSLLMLALHLTLAARLFFGRGHARQAAAVMAVIGLPLLTAGPVEASADVLMIAAAAGGYLPTSASWYRWRTVKRRSAPSWQ